MADTIGRASQASLLWSFSIFGETLLSTNHPIARITSPMKTPPATSYTEWTPRASLEQDTRSTRATATPYAR